MSEYGDYEEEAQRETFYAEVSDHAIKEFTTDRLRGFYEQNRSIGEKSYNALLEARKLLVESHDTAALIYAFISIETFLKIVLVQGGIHGAIHRDAMIEEIIELAVEYNKVRSFKKILDKIFHDLTGTTLDTYKRSGSNDTLWKEITDMQTVRNAAMHRGEAACEQKADLTVTVASVLWDYFFPIIAKKLGFHVHDGFKLCSEFYCTLPEAKKKIWREAGLIRDK